jgi:2-C-methyl-D-erythritol 4-phosphate cytidylyltransferase
MALEKYAIITGGGSGSRMQQSLPKQFLEIGGIPIIFYSIAAFSVYDPTIKIVITLPKDYFGYWNQLVAKHQFNTSHQLVEGGYTRFQSIKNALAKIPENSLVAIHDAVRPFVSAEVIANSFLLATQNGNAIPVVPLMDSIRKINETGNQILPRAEIFSVQTPQTFLSNQLLTAYQTDESSLFTDDASVYEHASFTVFPIDGNRENIKITTPIDLIVADAFTRHLLYHPSFPQIAAFQR